VVEWGELKLTEEEDEAAKFEKEIPAKKKVEIELSLIGKLFT